MQNIEEPATLVVAVADGTVDVSITVDAGVERAWLALADPVELARWFGQLDQPWLVGREGRAEFGDGDYFVVTACEIIDQRHLEFEWSFLGIGPVARISWSTEALPSATRITVRDHDPGRLPAENDQLAAGWSDFFSRLAYYLKTGRPCRYDLRGDIDGSIDIPVRTARPLSPGMIERWAPIAIDGFEPRWFFVIDDEGPRRFQIGEWSLVPDRQLTFTVAVQEGHATQCRVTAEQIGDATRVTFAHTGWHEVDMPGRQATLLRSRFVAAWVAALEQARTLALNAG